MKKENRFYNKCEALAKTIVSLQPMYLDASNDGGQKAYIETIIGAGLWYLSKGIWTGNISVNALELFLPESGENKPQYTEDHEYPRKVSGMELLNKDWSGDTDITDSLIELFQSRYGKVNYVTKNENGRLTKFQRVEVFKSPVNAYEEAGIDLITITDDELFEVKKRNSLVIEKLIAKA